MLEIDGIQPRLTKQVCEELLCQQYCYRGELQQAVDMLLLKVNGSWHQLYFDAGIVFWRPQVQAPTEVVAQPGDPLTYPFIDLGKKYALKGAVISDCITEPLVNGARVTFVFANKGSLLVSCSNNQSALRFIEAS